MHPGEVNTTALENTKTTSLENVSINVKLCLMEDNSMSETMVFCADESLEMVGMGEQLGVGRDEEMGVGREEMQLRGLRLLWMRGGELGVGR